MTVATKNQDELLDGLKKKWKNKLNQTPIEPDDVTDNVIKNGDEVAEGSGVVDEVVESGINSSKVDLDDLPQNAQEAFDKYDDAGWQGNVSGQTQGTNAGRKWGNRDEQLPTIDADGLGAVGFYR